MTITPLRPSEEHSAQHAAVQRVIKQVRHLFKEEETLRIFQEVLIRSLIVQQPRSRL